MENKSSPFSQKLTIPPLQKNMISLVIFVLLLLSITLLVVNFNKRTNTRSAAAAVSQETEDGIISGAATIQTDAEASGEQFVQFGQ